MLFDSDVTGILVLPRNFRISSLFTATCKNSASAECLSAADRVWKDFNVFRKAIASLSSAPICERSVLFLGLGLLP
jgi:hypothetical protein